MTDSEGKWHHWTSYVGERDDADAVVGVAAAIARDMTEPLRAWLRDEGIPDADRYSLIYDVTPIDLVGSDPVPDGKTCESIPPPGWLR